MVTRNNNPTPLTKKKKESFTNPYDRIKVKKHKYPNPNYKVNRLEVPFRMLIVGASGTAKTSTMLHVLKHMPNTFDKLIICCKSKFEPLYEDLEQRLGDLVEFHENGECPELEIAKPTDEHNLIVFDDLVLERNQDNIAEYFIRGRKMGYSCIYITQIYHSVPRAIRTQCSYVVLKRLADLQDLGRILRAYNLSTDISKLRSMHKDATADKGCFLTVDVDNNGFRKGLSRDYNIT